MNQMKNIISLSIFLLLPVLISSHITVKERFAPFAKHFALNNNEEHLPYDVEDNIFFSLDDVSKIFDEIIGFNINTTVDPAAELPTFSGLRFTTQQFDSVFPILLQYSETPLNVTFHLYSKLDPFGLLNFTDYKLAINFNVQIGVLVSEVSAEPMATFNLTGTLQLALVPVIRKLGVTLYLSDYSISDVVTASGQAATINQPALLEFLDTALQFGLAIANQELAQKIISVEDLLFL